MPGRTARDPPSKRNQKTAPDDSVRLADLVDYQEIRLRDAGPSFAGDLVSTLPSQIEYYMHYGERGNYGQRRR